MNQTTGVFVITFILVILGCGVFLGFSTFAGWSLLEGEGRAARVAMVLAVAGSIPFFLSALLPPAPQVAVLALVVLAFIALGVLFLLPVGKVEGVSAIPRKRYDERDIMFARARLEPGNPDYDAYYAMRPENKTSDDKTRALPGLLSPGASEANPLIFSATQASFGLTGALRDAVDGPVAPERREYSPDLMSAFVKHLSRYHGAHSTGITELLPYHVYSHIGRGSGEYGAEIKLDHRFAIAFTVEMERAMVGTGPAAPSLLESARQYAEAAKIAIQLANLIRNHGYRARAHIDGNYRVIAPLVARDAGMGEIGRMGLLMTPSLGPRVRLGVVTTDLPLVPDRRWDGRSMIDFCRICRKCADNCPVRAIPHDDRQDIDGVLRWRIRADVCYRYWCVVGTDCGRCMDVCPYSYPDSPMHKMVRWAARRSGFARRTALQMDRVFYGANPPPKAAPTWVPPGSSGD